MILLALPMPAAACVGVGCDGDTTVVGGASGIVDAYLTADATKVWIYEDGADPVNISGYVVIDAYAWAYAQGWAVSWEDWYWNWLPKNVDTYAKAFAEAGTSADFWYYVTGTHPNGNLIYSDTGYYLTTDWDWDKDFDKDSDKWWLWWGNDIVAYADAAAYAESPLYVYIPINYVLYPNQPGAYDFYAYGDSYLGYFAEAGFCTEYGCFGYDDAGKVIFIWDEAFLRILAVKYPYVPMGRFDIHEAPNTVIEVYNADAGGIQPWLGGDSHFELWTEDKGGGAYAAGPYHLHGGTVGFIWSWTAANGHQVFGSYDYNGPMSLSGWQQDIWKDGDLCWLVPGGALYCPKVPTEGLIAAFLKLDPNAATRNIRDDCKEALWVVYGMQTQLGRALTTLEYEAAVASVLG